MPHPLASDLDHVLEHTRDVWNDARGQRIFITGATGFFGCWFLETFAWANRRLDLGAKATILTRNPQKLEERLPHVAKEFDIVVGDVRTFAFPKGHFSHVIHGATESSAVLCTNEPEMMFDAIVSGTRHCLEFAAKAGANKFLLTSSGTIYGKQPSDMTHIPEDFSGGPDPLDPNSVYAEGKRAAELLCVIAAKRAGMEPKIARGFAFVGPYMKFDAHFAIGNFIDEHMKGGPLVVRGDGTPLRSYMYASDLMIWLWTILFKGESCRAYNVGSEDAISIAEMAHAVAEAGSPRSAVRIMETAAPGRPPARYIPSTARAQSELGLRCLVPLRDAIERTLQWNRMATPRELQVR
ncbi:MAG: NAD(P)-dependent oxidoreductase [Candidatus Sulfotelmatobacter sp.]